jgi:hypothetical protein
MQHRRATQPRESALLDRDNPRTPPAAYAVERWLLANGRTLQWLADEMNRRRTRAGMPANLSRTTLWRWFTGSSRIALDDATLISLISGTPVEKWSTWSVLSDRSTSRGG